MHDEITTQMIAIINEMNDRGFVIHNSIPLIPSCDTFIADDSVTLQDDENSDMEIPAFGGLSQTEHQFTACREKLSDTPVEQQPVLGTYYQQAAPVFEDLMSSCPNQSRCNEIISLLNTHHQKNIMISGKTNQKNSKGKYVLYGENPTNQRSEKRCGFAYERRQKFQKKK